MSHPPAAHSTHAPDAYRRSLPREEALLLVCARREIPASLQSGARLLAQGTDWERLGDLALQHRVAGMVYTSLKRDLSDQAPRPLLERLHQHILAGARGNLALLRETLRLTRQLDAHKIRFAIFKGLVINQVVYQDLGIRRCGDIDILISPEDFLRTRALLVEEGFLRTLSDTVERICMQSGLWHEQRQMTVDLHWGIPPRELGIRADKMLEDASEITISGHALPAFTARDLLVILCVNATKEHWNQLLYPYCDIHEFIRSHPGMDWRALFRRARELRCERMVRTALRMVSALYEIPDPAGNELVTDANDRAVRELLRHLFEGHPGENGNDENTDDNHSLHYFQSVDDYFLSLMDTPLQRLSYHLIHVPLRRHAPEAMGLSDIELPQQLAFLRPVVKTLHVCRLLLRKALRKLGRRAEPDHEPG